VSPSPAAELKIPIFASGIMVSKPYAIKLSDFLRTRAKAFLRMGKKALSLAKMQKKEPAASCPSFLLCQ
jgi:hypothetical protein